MRCPANFSLIDLNLSSPYKVGSAQAIGVPMTEIETKLPIIIRDATALDMEAVATIYNDAVTKTTAIWNNALVDAENRRGWLEDRLAKGYPVLVAADSENIVCGYAALGPFRAFDGYKYTSELSLYVRNGQRGRGIGHMLLRTLIERGKRQGFHALIAAIEANNLPSMKLHHALGFQQVGLLPQVGRKFERWLDLVLMQYLY